MPTTAMGRIHYGNAAALANERPARSLLLWQIVPWALLVWMAQIAAFGAEHDQTTLPTAQAIVSRMAAARVVNQARLRPYTVTRLYTLFSKDNAEPKSEVTAEVSFAPPNLKQYNIVGRTGSSLGEKLVRSMLDGETGIVKDYRSTDISLDNYEFELIGRAEGFCEHCYVIDLFPRRKEKTLLLGRMWIDAKSYLLRRMQAAPAKNPSWWLRDTQLQFLYADVGGMWLQTSSEFTTNVRIFGEYRMTSRDVAYEAADCAAVESTSLEKTGADQPPSLCDSPVASVP